MTETKRTDQIYGVSFDVNRQSLQDLRSLETLLSKIELHGVKLSGGKGLNIKVSNVANLLRAEQQRAQAIVKAEKNAIAATKQRAREELAAAKAMDRAEKQRSRAIEKAGKAAIAAAKQRANEERKVELAAAKAATRSERERSLAIMRARKAAIAAAKQRANEERKVELATLKTARAAEKAAKKAELARKQFKDTFLSIGSGSAAGFGSMMRHATAAAISLVSLHRVLQKIGEAKDRHLRFDELTTATMTIAHAGEKAFEYGSRGAEKYRDALRAAADEVKVSAADMADSALFWAKAGQTNNDTIVELSKVGTLFARANRDAANNVLDQARANDILSDALQLFRKDTSTTEKAMAAATDLGDKLTSAANAGNIVVEQLFEYSKKVAGLFKTGDVADEEIMAIATSLASAGLKEESGVHVRRILTQLAQGSVQKLLKNVGIEVSDQAGNIRSFGDIFGELQSVLKEQKPLERMSFLKELFGQRAVATAAAMAGLNEEGVPGNASIKAILEKIQESEGISRRNQEQYLKTTAGRVQALTSVWGNALDKVLEDSGIIEKVLSGLEDISPTDLFEWMNSTAIPALEGLGDTLANTVIPGIQMAAENVSEWLSPAMSILSGLLGSTTENAEGFSDTLTTIVKLWIKWRVAMMAIKALRMADWFAEFARKAAAAAAATKAIGTTTTASVGAAKTAVGGLAGAFSAAGIGISAAIAAWGIYDAIVGPIEDAERRIREFKDKYGDAFERLTPGKEKYDTIGGRIRDMEKTLGSISADSTINTGVAYGSGIDAQKIAENKRQRDAVQAEIDRLKAIQADQVRRETGVGTNDIGIGRYQGGKSTVYKHDRSAFWRPGMESGQTRQDVDQLYLDLHSAIQSGNADLLATAQEAYEDALNQKLAVYQNERADLQKERDETYEKFVAAAGDERDILHKQLGTIVDRLKDNADAIAGYTNGLDGIAGAMAKGQQEQRAEEVEKAVRKERKAIRDRSFHGGKTTPLNPFATPLMSGIDAKGNRVVNISLQKGNAAEYYKQSPEARAALGRDLKANRQIVNVNFGDASISVTAKSDAKPEDIARAVKDEWWKIGERQRQDVERILGVTAPPEI